MSDRTECSTRLSENVPVSIKSVRWSHYQTSSCSPQLPPIKSFNMEGTRRSRPSSLEGVPRKRGCWSWLCGCFAPPDSSSIVRDSMSDHFFDLLHEVKQIRHELGFVKEKMITVTELAKQIKHNTYKHHKERVNVTST